MSDRSGGYTGLSIESLAPSSGDVPAVKTYVVHTAASTAAGRVWVGGFGFQSSHSPVRPAVRAEGALRGLQAVLDSMPVEKTEPGAMDDLLQEIDEMAPGRRAATSILLGDAE